MRNIQEEAANQRSYHHGDLRRALIDAARRLLEAEGPAALSLRAVAREAGVSPAAPYHHFKDKDALLDAVAQQGWAELSESLNGSGGADATGGRTGNLGVAYVKFAMANPALYRLMYDVAREREALPEHEEHERGFNRLRETLIAAGADPNDKITLELAAIAAWCSAHGLAEMASFKQFQPLKDAVGGEEAFLRGVFEHMGVLGWGCNE
jgi:AcrR family transcriptional regulator